MTRTFSSALFAAASLVLGLACSESKDPSGADGGAAPFEPTAGSDAGAGTPGTGGGGGNEASGGNAPELPEGLVINEISADDEWVELKNAGANAVNLAGLLVADLDTETDGPKLDKAGSLTGSLAAGGYLIVIGDQDDPTSPVCPPAVSTCIGAGFKIGGTEGDSIFLVAGEASTARVDIGPAAVPDGSTWGRIPDGSGTFSVTSPTPGATNAN